MLVRTVSVVLDWFPLEQLIWLIDEPHRQVCWRVYVENSERFDTAWGSSHNHQCWTGGYVDHLADMMNHMRHAYALELACGRPMQFSLSDALLVAYLHDFEKPWRFEPDDELRMVQVLHLATKPARKAFREQKLKEYGFALTSAQALALRYVEGEGDDYSGVRRVMNELGSFCHRADIWSAREAYDYPKERGVDEWYGAGRYRSPAW